MCFHFLLSEYLASPPGSAATPPGVYWAECSPHRPAVTHHKKGQQQSHDAVSKHAFNPSYCLTVNIYSSLNIKTSNVTRVFNFCCDKLNNYIWCFDHIVFYTLDLKPKTQC